MLTPTERHWHKVYEALPRRYRTQIDDAYTLMHDSLTRQSHRFALSGDDRAERVVASIARYVCECNPQDPGVVQALIDANAA